MGTISAAATLDQAQARAVLAVHAIEGDGDSPLWTAEDRAWATRLARQEMGAQAPLAAFVSLRAHHALQRLGPRIPGLAQWLSRRSGLGAWWLAAVALGLVAGIAIDQLGGGQRINLLAPPVWGVVAWNLAVYIVILFGAGWPGRAPAAGPRAWLQRLWRPAPALRRSPALARVVTHWQAHAAALTTARATVLLHSAAAALAIGLVIGLYTRGLVLDFRAGWQSTFLEAPAVQRTLDVLLAPAALATGIAVPDVAPLRVLPEAAPIGPAAPWLHLYGATLVLLVVLPRLAVALAARWRAHRRSAHFVLPWQDAYFQQLARQQGSRRARVQVLPHGSAPGANAALPLRELLLRRCGDDLELWIEPTTAYGGEDTPAAASPAAADATLRVALFDLAATPEAEVQGRWLGTLRQGAAELTVVVDESALRRRFASMPERLEQRRAAWREFCAATGVDCRFADLAR